MAFRAPDPVAGERAGLMQSLARQRHFLRSITRGLTDEQAAQRTTASELSPGDLIKHVALTEQHWMRFIIDGPAAMSWDEASAGDWMAGFKMLDGETLAGLLETYVQAAHRTGEPVAQLPDLDVAHPLPPAPWSEAGARWSARRLLHVIAETAQHPDHADIIRESLHGRRRWDSQVDTTHQRPSNVPRPSRVRKVFPRKPLMEQRTSRFRKNAGAWSVLKVSPGRRQMRIFASNVPMPKHTSRTTIYWAKLGLLIGRPAS